MYKFKPWPYLLGYMAAKPPRDLDCVQNKPAAVRAAMGGTAL